MKLIKNLYGDYMKSPRSMKIAFPTFLIACVCIIQACASIGPSPEFVIKQKENHELLFPIFETMINDASNQTIAKVLGIESLSDRAVRDYKDSLKIKLQSWRFLIDKENEIVKGYANE